MSYELLRDGKEIAKGGVRVSIPATPLIWLGRLLPASLFASSKTLALDVAEKLAGKPFSG